MNATPGELMHALMRRGLYEPLEALCHPRMTTPSEVLSDSRTRHVVDVRREFVAYLRHERGLSYLAIGTLIGRDNSTVVNLLRKIEGRPPRRKIRAA